MKNNYNVNTKHYSEKEWTSIQRFFDPQKYNKNQNSLNEGKSV